jgi:hypothetical protein
MLENFSFNRVIAILSGKNPLHGVDVLYASNAIWILIYSILFVDI